MEELPQQLSGGGGPATAEGSNFLYFPSFTAASSSPAAAFRDRPGNNNDHGYYYPHHHAYLHPPPPSSQGEASGYAEDGMKAKIMSHPQCSTLIAAFIDCQKVGAPPDVVARLSELSRELDSRLSRRRREGSDDPELDQFMEAYCDVLVKYRDELSRPLQEATDFLKSAESQFNALTNAASSSSSRPLSYSAEEQEEDAASSEEELDPSSGEAADGLKMDPRAEDKELKLHLLKKYSGYLSSLRQELSKKKKKGKLPKEARLKLLKWWELHYKWPYPSESEKIALAESTGLDQKQINNWFINQRKRHWKPSEDMQLMVMEGFHPHNAAATLCMEAGQFMGGDQSLYRLLGP